MVHDITFFSVGAALTGLLITALAPDARYRLTAMTLGGIWATIPRFVREIRWFDRYLGWATDPSYAQLFWFHYTVSRIGVDPDFAVRESDATAAVAVGFLLLVVTVVEFRARQRGRLASVLSGPHAGAQE